jgi:hypothetical protein
MRWRASFYFTKEYIHVQFSSYVIYLYIQISAHARLRAIFLSTLKLML